MAEEHNSEKILNDLLDLSEKGEIKYTTRQIKKTTESRREQVYREYELKEMDATNELISDMLIIKFEELLKGRNMIKEDSTLARKLQDRTMFKKDVKNIVGYFTPLLPFVGLIEGAVVTSSEVISKFNDDRKNKKNEGDTCTTEKGEESDQAEGDESEHE